MGGGMYRKLEVVGIGSGWADLTELRGKDILCLQMIRRTYVFLNHQFLFKITLLDYIQGIRRGQIPICPSTIDRVQSPL